MAQYEAVIVGQFDARKGYKRWGYGTETRIDGLLGRAYLWKNRKGRLFARFKCQIYSLHLEIKAKNGSRISMTQNSDVQDFLDRKLFNWLLNDVDDDDIS